MIQTPILLWNQTLPSFGKPSSGGQFDLKDNFSRQID